MVKLEVGSSRELPLSDAEPVGTGGCCAETDAEEGEDADEEEEDEDDEDEEGGRSRAAKRVTLGAMICSKGFCTNMVPGIPGASGEGEGEDDAAGEGEGEVDEGVPADVNGTIPTAGLFCVRSCRG